MTAALRRETRRERASQLAKTGLTASAGWNFVVRMVLGRRQPASTPTQPSLVRSILSRRSSQTIQSEYYFLMVLTFLFPLTGVARSLQVARDATTSVRGGMEKLAAKITERLENAFCLLSD